MIKYIYSKNIKSIKSKHRFLCLSLQTPTVIDTGKHQTFYMQTGVRLGLVSSPFDGRKTKGIFTLDANVWLAKGVSQALFCF